MNDYYCMSRPEIFKLIPSGVQRILEIGCAAGRFRLNFKMDVEYWGVEPVAEAASAAKLLGIRVLNGPIESVMHQLPDGYFDVIVCNDVIEHIYEADVMMEGLRQKLAKGGLLVGSIPNVRCWSNLVRLLLCRDWRYEDSGILDRTHVRFYTKKSFMRLLTAHGFRVDLIRGVESRRMKALKPLVWPFLAIVGADVCAMQLAFRAILDR